VYWLKPLAIETIKTEGQLNIPILFDLGCSVDVIHFAASAGTARCDFRFTSLITSMRAYDENGRDVTGAFDFWNSAGDPVFSTSEVTAVPEPGTAVAIAIALLMFLLRRLQERHRWGTDRNS
jgi:hypothetical protein